LYRWATGYFPETACSAVAGVGTGKTGPTTATAKGRLAKLYECSKTDICYFQVIVNPGMNFKVSI
jgi:hypothetical protein